MFVYYRSTVLHFLSSWLSQFGYMLWLHILCGLFWNFCCNFCLSSLVLHRERAERLWLKLRRLGFRFVDASLQNSFRCVIAKFISLCHCLVWLRGVAFLFVSFAVFVCSVANFVFCGFFRFKAVAFSWPSSRALSRIPRWQGPSFW